MRSIGGVEPENMHFLMVMRVLESCSPCQVLKDRNLYKRMQRREIEIEKWAEPGAHMLKLHSIITVSFGEVLHIMHMLKLTV